MRHNHGIARLGVFRALAISAIGVLAFSGVVQPANAAAARPAAGCDAYLTPTVSGGSAEWLISCVAHTSGYVVVITGSVTDTKADGKCAYVKAFDHYGHSMPIAKACPKGKTTSFQWQGQGTSIDAYLYTA